MKKLLANARNPAGAALALFNRTINGVDIASGSKPITANYGTSGSPNATHTEPVPTAPYSLAASASSYQSYAASVISSYMAKDQSPYPSSAAATATGTGSASSSSSSKSMTVATRV